MRPSPHSMMGSDSSALDGVRLPRGLVRRVWAFSGKYHRRVGRFLLIIVVEALLGLIPPLLIRQLVDHTIPDKNTAGVTVLGSIMIGAAFANAGLSLAERWLSSVIGEGLIYDLRAALFDHVQRMPIAFFTRTQTGSLQSRLNSDVVGAQQAVTTTLGTVLQNFIQLAVTLTIMFRLDWRITLLTLVALPAFIYPARWLG